MADAKLDVMKVRADFPILKRKVRESELVYLDSAASSLKPEAVIERMTTYYRNETSNVHRGAHFLAEQGTLAYEGARATVAKFVKAKSPSEIVFTRGTTEAINLVAQTYGRMTLKSGDEILLTELEHHSNIVPWQLIAQEKGAKIKVIPITDEGEIDFVAFEKLLSPKTKIVAMSWCSNVLGTVTPIRRFADAAHRVGAKLLVDAAQGIAQRPADVLAMDCDFLTFSGHKVFGPYGIGVLYAKAELLEAMPPYQGGGSMIAEVTFEKTTWAAVPHKFEAGTPEIPGAIGLAAALDYVGRLGFDAIAGHERDLVGYAMNELAQIDGLKIIGHPKDRAAIVSFNVDGVHASDLGTVLDQQGIAIRAGHHCCQPLMRRLGISATARASLSIYNTRAEIDALKKGLLKAKEIFS